MKGYKMKYSLYRIYPNDNMGDSGMMSEAIDPITFKVIGYRPVVGCCMRVGSFMARTYQYQDWWMTTPIIEIIEEDENKVVFSTQNSTYEWKQF